MRRLEQYRSMIEEALPAMLPPAFGYGGVVVEAARYSLLSGGKRIRPSLLLAACDFAGGDVKEALPAACAIECLHVYSMIHDDLPAMDDDDLRRGKPSCHKQYGEDIAILAGDGLNTHAFWLIAEGARKVPEHSERHMRAMSHIATAAGFYGMVAGQAADIRHDATQLAPDLLRFIHLNKTGVLMRAALLGGIAIGGGDLTVERMFADYGTHLGLAFQAADDVLDATSTAEELGKPAGRDAQVDRPTIVALLGLDGARARVKEESEEAIAALSSLGESASFFVELTRTLVNRKK